MLSMVAFCNLSTCEADDIFDHLRRKRYKKLNYSGVVRKLKIRYSHILQLIIILYMKVLKFGSNCLFFKINKTYIRICTYKVAWYDIIDKTKVSNFLKINDRGLKKILWHMWYKLYNTITCIYLQEIIKLWGTRQWGRSLSWPWTPGLKWSSCFSLARGLHWLLLSYLYSN